jgi:hypothetical protein
MKCTVLIFDTRRFGGVRETCITALLVSATYLLGKPLLFTLYFVATALFGDEIGAVLLLASTVELTKPRHTKKSTCIIFSFSYPVIFSGSPGFWRHVSFKSGYRFSVITFIEGVLDISFRRHDCNFP